MSHRTEREIVLAFLYQQREAEGNLNANIDHVERGRIRVMELARRYSWTWDEIGDALGIKGDTARKQYERGL